MIRRASTSFAAMFALVLLLSGLSCGSLEALLDTMV